MHAPAAVPAVDPKAPAPAAADAASSTATDAAKAVVKKPMRFLTAKERLPKGLPDWFADRDADGDGQVTMAEFAERWTPDTAREFDHYDRNHDGVVTAAECLKAGKGRGSRE